MFYGLLEPSESILNDFYDSEWLLEKINFFIVLSNFCSIQQLKHWIVEMFISILRQKSDFQTFLDCKMYSRDVPGY